MSTRCLSWMKPNCKIWSLNSNKQDHWKRNSKIIISLCFKLDLHCVEGQVYCYITTVVNSDKDQNNWSYRWNLSEVSKLENKM